MKTAFHFATLVQGLKLGNEAIVSRTHEWLGLFGGECCTETTLPDDNSRDHTACYMPKHQPCPLHFRTLPYSHDYGAAPYVPTLEMRGRGSFVASMREVTHAYAITVGHLQHQVQFGTQLCGSIR